MNMNPAMKSRLVIERFHNKQTDKHYIYLIKSNLAFRVNQT
jgi:hypothetical protein